MFILATTREGTRVLINMNHVENIHEDGDGSVVTVYSTTMIGQQTRVYKLKEPFDQLLAMMHPIKPNQKPN